MQSSRPRQGRIDVSQDVLLADDVKEMREPNQLRRLFAGAADPRGSARLVHFFVQRFDGVQSRRVPGGCETLACSTPTCSQSWPTDASPSRTSSMMAMRVGWARA